MTAPSRSITSVIAERILDEYTHEISVPTDTPTTILYGPNGVGKTKFLEIIKAATEPDPWSLWRLPFKRAVINYSDGYKLVVEFDTQNRNDNFQDPSSTRPTDVLLMSIIDSSGKTQYSQTFDDLDDDTWITSSDYPARRISDDLWEDRTIGDYVPTGEIRRRIGVESSISKIKPEIIEFCETAPTFLIETQRLYHSSQQSPFMRRRPMSPRFPRRPSTSSRIEQQAKHIQEQIRATLREHSFQAQRLDRTFPGRALKRGKRENYDQGAVLKRYAEQNEFRQRLSLIMSRLRSDEEFSLPDQLTQSDLRLLSLYLDDTDQKLQPFRELIDKIDILEEVLNNRLLNKKIKVDDDNGLLITKMPSGDRLSLTDLSSGEQHEIILMTDLLFNAPQGSVVLIDEPEISLHVAWHVRFIDDVEKIAENCGFKLVIATHSPQIINERWTQAKQLGPKGVTL